MPTGFEDWVRRVEAEDGEEGRRDLEWLRCRYALANQLLTVRRERALTQQDVARRAGVQQADISRIERGAGNPTVSTLHRLGAALGVQLRYVDDAGRVAGR